MMSAGWTMYNMDYSNSHLTTVTTWNLEQNPARKHKTLNTPLIIAQDVGNALLTPKFHNTNLEQLNQNAPLPLTTKSK